jgi:hypothetical protein
MYISIAKNKQGITSMKRSLLLANNKGNLLHKEQMAPPEILNCH